jgi:hypothetical protein
MATISVEQFNQKVQEQNDLLKAKKWRELETDKIYTITSAEFFTTQYGDACVITCDNEKVWAPSGLIKRLKQDKKAFPRYVRPIGLVKCKTNLTQTYYGFELV